MDSHGIDETAKAPEALPTNPPNRVSLQAECVPKLTTKIKPKRLPMARPGYGRKGSKIELLSNHFRVHVANVGSYFFHYNVAMLYEDSCRAVDKGIRRRLIDKLHETYRSELGGKVFAYDGKNSLFTVGPLPGNKFEFIVVLERISSSRTGNSGNGISDSSGSQNEGDQKRLRRPNQAKTFRIEISFVAKIPITAIKNAISGEESENSQEALGILNIILRQHAAKQGCLLVRQSFFHNHPRDFFRLGGGLLGCRGFHSSFRVTQGGLSLNMNTTTTITIQPGPVVDFLIDRQNVRSPDEIDWTKAKRSLKNLRMKTSHSNREHKITGLSDRPCNQQRFLLKWMNGNGDLQATEVSVYDYFVNYLHIKLNFSAKFPCINVGQPDRPTYFPLELCSLVSLQRYTKALSTCQKSILGEKLKQKPQEKMKVISDTLKSSSYDADKMLHACGISINTNFSRVEGRVLPPPKLKVGNGEDFFPKNGRWNFNDKKLVQPVKIKRWAIVNFSACCDVQQLCQGLIKCGGQKGVLMSHPLNIFEENPEFKYESPLVRVERMFKRILPKLPDPQFLLCLLPDRKTSAIYGPWKKKNLCDFGIVTQCIVPTRVNDQYLTSVLLKINAKLGGLNFVLAVEYTRSIPLISKIPTMILGMDVSHGSAGSLVPSIAAVVGSRQWPFISRYRACVRSQSPKVEMINSLFKKVSDRDDHGIVRELLLDFYKSSGKRRPEHILIFRDGVSESQFDQVLSIELDQIIEACKLLDGGWSPKFTVIIVQKRHHTRFFQTASPCDNVPPGTVIDNQICDSRSNDFYIFPHFGMIGTSRPTHYHVLHDEIGFSADGLQELVHSLSYVYQRSTTAISLVAPVAYAHHAASQVSQFVDVKNMAETSTCAGDTEVPKLPTLHKNVRSSMFFC